METDFHQDPRMFLDGLKKTGKTLEYVPEGGTLRVLLQ
jgi:hypothetical protein